VEVRYWPGLKSVRPQTAEGAAGGQ
jgi:hypothetical protein